MRQPAGVLPARQQSPTFIDECNPAKQCNVSKTGLRSYLARRITKRNTHILVSTRSNKLETSGAQQTKTLLEQTQVYPVSRGHRMTPHEMQRLHKALSLQLMQPMTEPENLLAAKLMSEGKKTKVFFESLSEAAWQTPIYTDGAQWDARETLAHLIQAEASLRALFERVVAGGDGAPVDFDIERFNREHTGRLASLSRDELLQRYADERRATADFADGLSASQLALRGRHPALGDSSIEDMLKLIYLHNSMHVRDIKKAG